MYRVWVTALDQHMPSEACTANFDLEFDIDFPDGAVYLQAHACRSAEEDPESTLTCLMGRCSYKYTPADLQKKIQDRRDRGAVGNLVAEQARLTNFLAAAQDSGNAEETER